MHRGPNARQNPFTPPLALLLAAVLVALLSTLLALALQ